MNQRHSRLTILAGCLLMLAACKTTGEGVKYPTAARPGLSDPAEINATIYKPDGVGPFPAVIVLHGCGGLTKHGYQDWARSLNSWGYVAMVVDSFGSRGHGNICTQTSLVLARERVSDVIGAADVLNRQPYVKAGSIGLIGFSHGGQTVLKAVQERHGLGQNGIKAAVAYYPPCEAGDIRINMPLLILMGANDSWTPPQRCLEFETRRALLKPELVQMVVYPDTYHAFDEAFPVTEILGQGPGGSVSKQKLGRNPQAASDAEQRTKQFFDEHLK